MWDERYSTDDYVYGTEPNDFLRDQVALIGKAPKKVLCLADGEGRNGVYLAALGHQVLSVDISAVGLRKAEALAKDKGVPLDVLVADLAAHEFPAASFDAVVSVFCHLPQADRPHLHHQVAQTLKPGGILILEAYTPAQASRDTGGPGTPDRTLTAAELETAFANFSIEMNRELDRQIIEGRGHNGLGAVVQFIARKPLSQAV